MSALLTRVSETRAAPAGPERRALGTRGIAATRERDELEGVGPDPAGAPAGGRLTLGQRLDSVWEGLRAGGAPDCPVCDARLGPLGESPAVRCNGCGTVLS